MYHKWKRQLSVGINASLRNSRPLKSPDLKRLEEENRKLKCIEPVINDNQLKKRDEPGLRTGRLMKKQIIQFVHERRQRDIQSLLL